MSFLMNMCPLDLEYAKGNKAILILGIGSIEYHGSQLPLGTDFYLVDCIIKSIEKRLPDKIVAAPTLPISPTGFAVSGPDKGTIDIDVDVFMDYCDELLDSYERLGFSKILILVHHQGGNIIMMLKTLLAKQTMYNRKYELGESWWTEKKKSPMFRSPVEVIPAMLDTHYFGGHGGKGETEGILAMKPELVHMENIKDIDTEAFWNKTVVEADANRANKQYEDLINKWVEMIATM